MPPDRRSLHRRRRRSCFEITREEQRRRRLVRRRAEEDAVAIGEKLEGFMSVLMSVLAWSLMPRWMRGGASYPLTPLPAPRGRPVPVLAPSVTLSPLREPMTSDELAWSNGYAAMRAIWSGSAAPDLVAQRWRELRALCPDVIGEIGRVAAVSKQEREALLREMRSARHGQSPAAAARMTIAQLRREKAARQAEAGPDASQIVPEPVAGAGLPRPSFESDDANDELSELKM